MLVDAGGAIGAGAGVNGELAAFEAAEEVLPLGVDGPAAEPAALYAQRWEIETHQRGSLAYDGTGATAHLVEAAWQRVHILGPGTLAGARPENIARFVDFVSESIARAAEQARDILYTKPETPSDGTA